MENNNFDDNQGQANIAKENATQNIMQNIISPEPIKKSKKSLIIAAFVLFLFSVLVVIGIIFIINDKKRDSSLSMATQTPINTVINKQVGNNQVNNNQLSNSQVNNEQLSSSSQGVSKSEVIAPFPTVTSSVATEKSTAYVTQAEVKTNTTDDKDTNTTVSVYFYTQDGKRTIASAKNVDGTIRYNNNTSHTINLSANKFTKDQTKGWYGKIGIIDKGLDIWLFAGTATLHFSDGTKSTISIISTKLISRDGNFNYVRFY